MIFLIFQLGSQNVYLVNSSEFIKKILIYDHGNFKKATRAQIAKGLLGEGLVTNRGRIPYPPKKIDTANIPSETDQDL